MLDVGQKFPEFSLPDQDGKKRTLKEFRGRWLVLYVYPKDDTPGCTIQGKSFTAAKEQFDREGITVVGISQDDVQSHKNFCNKFSFEIDLLADTQAQILSEAGVGQTDYKGTMYWDRTTFVLDPQGVVRKIYTKVKPEGHEQTLLNDIRALKSS